MDVVMKAAENAVNEIIEKVQTDKRFYLEVLIYTLRKNEFTFDQLKQIGLLINDFKTNEY